MRIDCARRRYDLLSGGLLAILLVSFLSRFSFLVLETVFASNAAAQTARAQGAEYFITVLVRWFAVVHTVITKARAEVARITLTVVIAHGGCAPSSKGSNGRRASCRDVVMGRNLFWFVNTVVSRKKIIQYSITGTVYSTVL